MQKPAPSEVKPFQFGALEGTADTKVAWREFEMPPLGVGGKPAPAAPAKVIRAEREAESRSQFKIEGIVREYRGLSSQEQDDLEKRINIEVEKKLRETRDAAYREGIEKGRQEGVGNAFAEASAVHQEQIEAMAGIVEGLRAECAGVLETQHHDAYEMLKRLLKWLVLRDVSDQAYLPKLLEKLILEMSQRQNLLIRVHPEDFAAMPAVLEALEKRLGSLTNVRVEPNTDMSRRGIILESENGIIDGSTEAMFQTLDKLFETVVGHES